MGEIDQDWLRNFLDRLPHMTPDVQLSLGWTIFLFGITRFGHVTITGDMEDYGREPGDIVWVNIGDDSGVLGEFPEAVARATLNALQSEGPS